MNYIPNELFERIQTVQRARELTYKGIRQINDGDFSNALATFNESLTLNPMHIMTYQYRAICKILLNDTSGAMDDMFQVIDQFETSREIPGKLLETYHR